MRALVLAVLATVMGCGGTIETGASTGAGGGAATGGEGGSGGSAGGSGGAAVECDPENGLDPACDDSDPCTADRCSLDSLCEHSVIGGC